MTVTATGADFCEAVRMVRCDPVNTMVPIARDVDPQYTVKNTPRARTHP